MINVYIKRPGMKPTFAIIESETENIRQIIGDKITSEDITPDIRVLYNENGRFYGGKYNEKIKGKPIYGIMLIVGIDGDKITAIEKTEGELRKIMPYMWERK